MLQQDIEFYWLQAPKGNVKEGDIYVPAEQRSEQEWDTLFSTLNVPVTNVLKKVQKDRFTCPGSVLRLNINTGHPINYGMQAEEAGYFGWSPAFQTTVLTLDYIRCNPFPVTS